MMKFIIILFTAVLALAQTKPQPAASQPPLPPRTAAEEWHHKAAVAEIQLLHDIPKIEAEYQENLRLIAEQRKKGKLTAAEVATAQDDAERIRVADTKVYNRELEQARIDNQREVNLARIENERRQAQAEARGAAEMRAGTKCLALGDIPVVELTGAQLGAIRECQRLGWLK